MVAKTIRATLWASVRAALVVIGAVSALVASVDAHSKDAKGPVPWPPLLAIPLSKIEPSKNVPVEQWNAPYCLQWGDGCALCKRKYVSAHIACKSTVSSESVCIIRFIMCEEYDQFTMGKICKLETMYSFYIDELPTNKQAYEQFLNAHAAEHVVHDWEFRRGRWTDEGDAEIGREGPGRSIPPEVGVSCAQTYTRKDIELIHGAASIRPQM